MVGDKKQLDEYKYAILMIGGSIIVTVLLGTLIGGPLWKNLKKDTETLKISRAELEFQSKRLANLKGLASKEAELKEKNTKVLAALPEEKDISRLFVQFENISAQSGLKVERVAEESGTGVAPPADGVKPLIAPITYSVVSKGENYQSLKNALINFEKALRLVSVDKIEVSVNRDEFEIKFIVTTYKRG